MNSRTEELKQFKRIDLVTYAVSRGFQLDRKASSRSSIVVRHANGDKLIIGKSSDGSFHYFNAKGDDAGTIVDLVQALDGGTLGDVRKTLRRYEPSGHNAVETPIEFGTLAARSTDSGKVDSAWERSTPLRTRNAYLSDCRMIHEDVYLNPRFAGRFRVDARGNVMAAHHNENGLCGFEIKNGTSEQTTFTGFSPGGVKGLMSSRPRPSDQIMVIAETFIDLLSVAAIAGGHGRRFFSLGGSPSPAQLELLRSAARKMPNRATIEIRVDNDEGGKKIASLLQAELCIDDCQIANISHQPPPEHGTDWNDHLKQISRREYLNHGMRV